MPLTSREDGNRFEPRGEEEVTLVQLGGKQHVLSFAKLVDGWTGGATTTYRPMWVEALKNAQEQGFKSNKK